MLLKRLGGAAKKDKESGALVLEGEGPNNQHDVKGGCGEGRNKGGDTEVVIRGGLAHYVEGRWGMIV